MNEFEEYIRTHNVAMLEALTLCKKIANEFSDGAQVAYFQHEIFALIEIIRKLPKSK